MKEFKLVVLGSGGVGKSALVRRHILTLIFHKLYAKLHELYRCVITDDHQDS